MLIKIHMPDKVYKKYNKSIVNIFKQLTELDDKVEIMVTDKENIYHCNKCGEKNYFQPKYCIVCGEELK